MQNRVSLFLVGVAVIAQVAVLAAEAPVAVSPGSATGAVIESRCPTFSWGGVDGARSYELVVYHFGEEGEEGEEAMPVLRQTFPGSVDGWTPSLDACLERGGQYAWSVRAVGREEASEWSPPRLFQVASGRSEAEFEAALQVVRQYVVSQRGASSGGAVDETQAGSESKPGTDASSSPISAGAAATQLTVDGGVEATSFTGDGSTLTSLNASSLSAGTVAEARIAATIARDSEVPGIVGPHTTDTSCDGAACDGTGFSGVTAVAGDSATGFFATGQIEEARIADEIARDSEVETLIAWVAWAQNCPDKVGFRYSDQGNGTVVDCATGLIWLRDANCFGFRNWGQAESDAAGLASGACGLTDGSSMAGDWRQPTISELCSAWSGSGLFPCPASAASDSLIDSSVSGSPKVVNAKGDAGWTTDEDAFVGVHSNCCWSATEAGADAWGVTLSNGNVLNLISKGSVLVVWPVRDAP